MGLILERVFDALPYLLAALPAVAVARVLLALAARRRGMGTTACHELGCCVFLLFLVALASQTVVPKLEFGPNGVGIVNGNLRGSLNFIPGAVFADLWRECVRGGHWTLFFTNFLGNIALFVPVGFFPPLLWRGVTGRRALLFGLGGSLLIELCQLPQARGTDVDDLWLNGLGVLLGYAVFVWWSRRHAGSAARFRMRKKAG